MNLSADEKVNMSLDDLIKLKRKQNEKPANKKGPKVKISAISNAARGPKKGKPIRKSTGATPNKNNNPASAKIAKSVGSAAAKRNANINKKRGLNTTGKATNSQINKSINRASKNANNQVMQSGLKISFNSAELNKTTDKTVAQQIKAVLSRQATKRNDSKNINAGNGPKPKRPKGKGLVLRR